MFSKYVLFKKGTETKGRVSGHPGHSLHPPLLHRGENVGCLTRGKSRGINDELEKRACDAISYIQWRRGIREGVTNGGMRPAAPGGTAQGRHLGWRENMEF